MEAVDQVFGLGNLLALAGWASLLAALFAPRVRKTLLGVAGLAIPLLFACAYVLLLATAKDLSGGFGSIAQVRALFDSDAALTAGWFHYLAFDLFVGSFIVRDGLERGVARLAIAPCLVPTFLFGPSGLLLYAVVRLGFARRKRAAAV